jgi:hypothetical protein
MSDYAIKLSSILDKKQKLINEESKFIQKRKHEIAELAQRCGVLTFSDELLAGLFVQASQASITKDKKIQEWEHEGKKYLNQKQYGKQATARAESAEPA